MLGEGAGVGYLKGQDTMPIPEDSTLYDLVQMGIKSTHAAVSVVVRLRKELSLVKDVPVLIAIDQVSPPTFPFMIQYFVVYYFKDMLLIH